jgi:hypothetical protein
MSGPVPLVVAATFCESVLEDKSGQFSIIRMLDTVAIPTLVQAPDTIPVKPLFQVMLFVGLKSGDVRGKRTITLRLRTPSNELKALGDPVPMLFEGGEHGTVLRVALNLGIEEYGLYWAEILVDNELVGKAPLKLRQVEEQLSTRTSR